MTIKIEAIVEALEVREALTVAINEIPAKMMIMAMANPLLED